MWSLHRSNGYQSPDAQPNKQRSRSSSTVHRTPSLSSLFFNCFSHVEDQIQNVLLSGSTSLRERESSDSFGWVGGPLANITITSLEASKLGLALDLGRERERESQACLPFLPLQIPHFARVSWPSTRFFNTNSIPLYIFYIVFFYPQNPICSRLVPLCLFPSCLLSFLFIFSAFLHFLLTETQEWNCKGENDQVGVSICDYLKYHIVFLCSLNCFLYITRETEVSLLCCVVLS